MKKALLVLLVLILAACGKSDSPARIELPTVRTLAADPGWLKELRQQCKLDRANLADALCNRVAEATNKRSLAMARCPIRRPRHRRSSDRRYSRHTNSVFFFNTPQSAPACGVLLGFAPALTLSFCTTFVPITIFDRH
jgi:hypothetical protein